MLKGYIVFDHLKCEVSYVNNFIKSSIGLVFGLILIIGGTKEVFAIGDPGNTIGDRLGCDKKISDQFKSGGKLDEKKLDDALERRGVPSSIDRKSTRLNSSHVAISYA